MNMEQNFGYEKEPNPSLGRVLFYLHQRFSVVESIRRQTAEDIDEHPDSYKLAAGNFSNLEHDSNLEFMFIEHIILTPPERISDRDILVDELEAMLDRPPHRYIPRREQLNGASEDEISRRLLDRRLHVYRAVDVDNPNEPLLDFEDTYVLRYEAGGDKRNHDLLFVLNENSIEQFPADNKSAKPAFMSAMEYAVLGESANRASEDSDEMYFNTSRSMAERELSSMIETSLAERNLTVFQDGRNVHPTEG